MEQKHIQHLGTTVKLVPREQLRRKANGRTLFVPRHLRSLAATIPTPPPSFDGSKGRTIQYPIMGNDQYGCCYYADAVHCVQTWTGNSGIEAGFDVTAMCQRYLQLSGGDNGLADDQIFPEWKSGIIGPNGLHKILDDMTIDPRDRNAVKLGMWLFCGASYTASLLTGWTSNPSPGQVWDANMGHADPRAGHAMHLSGYDSNYYYDETWGFNPPIRLTPAGLEASDPEVSVQFSLDMFNAQGVAPHNGMSYDDLARLWVALGGQNLPPNPFHPSPPTPTPPPPVPPPGPTPPTPSPTPGAWWGWVIQTAELWLQLLGPLAVPLIEQLIKELPLPPLVITMLESLIEQYLHVKHPLKVA